MWLPRRHPPASNCSATARCLRSDVSPGRCGFGDPGILRDAGHPFRDGFCWRPAYSGASPGTQVSRCRAVTALTYIFSGLICAFAGILLSATVSVYVPYSGNAFLLNAIGATFIGTTLKPAGPSQCVGKPVGHIAARHRGERLVALRPQLLLQQVGTGTLIFIVLAVDFRQAPFLRSSLRSRRSGFSRWLPRWRAIRTLNTFII